MPGVGGRDLGCVARQSTCEGSAALGILRLSSVYIDDGSDAHRHPLSGPVIGRAWHPVRVQRWWAGRGGIVPASRSAGLARHVVDPGLMATA